MTRRRILSISNHQDAVDITSPPGGIVNITICDPSDFLSINGFMASRQHEVFAVGSLTGITSLFCNNRGNIHEICIKPFLHSWPRFVAVLGQVFETSSLFFRTWADGVVLSSGVFDSHGPRIFPDKRDANTAPISGANLAKNDRS